ncbi:MAG: aminodeoxychorismate synthase component I [Rhodospirillales bacterium]|nr:aminodeoxychorismate synthase component I [Rhodospirillales bacterium]
MEITAPFVLFDDAHSENGSDPQGLAETRMRLYASPLEVLECRHAADVPDTLAKIDHALASGHHVAGYLAYELGYLLEPKLASLLPDNLDGPLIWMGVFATAQLLDADESAALLNDWAQEDHHVGPLTTAMIRERYMANVETVRDHIRAGDIYQINYTFKQRFAYSGSALSLYAALRDRQRASFGALIATGTRHILSLSPELFVEVQGGIARTRPMKGTAARAASTPADAARRHWLRDDEKSKAENLMIVDLLRNDLGRVAQVGSVTVTDLFSVETYPTLHQMTSGIEARLRADVSFSQLIGALFPCGSVTGAPKVKAMEIIRTLEDAPRGVYTGAIGYASATDGIRFNVAIRTLDLDNAGHGEMGIGSGIVYDSDAGEEWDECHLKARFLTDADQPAFALLETLKWDNEAGFALLDRHLDRLAESAAYFCFPYHKHAVMEALNAAVLGHKDPLRLRLTLDAHGAATVETKPLKPLGADGVLYFAVSDKIVDTDSPFTHHKTTRRAFYDDERARAQSDEVLFLNAQGELTEGSFTNVFVELAEDMGGVLRTPPTSCGLLAGTLRQELLDSGRAIEAILTLSDLKAPNRVFLGNSVRGLMPAKAVPLKI